MSPHEVNQIAGQIALLAAVPAHLNVIIYGLGSRWWRSALGVTMFAKWLAVALVFDVVLLRRAFGDYTGYEWVALFTYSFITLAFTATTVELVIERRAAAPAPTQERIGTMSDLTEGGRHIGVSAATVPEIWYKGKRVVRTIVQALVIYVPLVNIIAVIIVDFLTKQTDLVIPAWLFGALNGIVLATALLMGLVAKLMAHPTVNAWLVKFGLGSVPKAAVEAGRV